MGGNVTIDGCPAPQPIRVEDRHVVYSAVQELYRDLVDDILWMDGFSGSSRHLFDVKIADEKLKDYKEEFGDVDIIAPKQRKPTALEILEQPPSNELYEILGYKQHGNEISLIVNVFPISRNPIQVDFEFKEFDFEAGLPSDFAIFSQSSPLEDFKAGIPGVYHKQLLMALTAANSTMDDVIYKRNTENPVFRIEINPMYKFSIAKGLRKTLEETDSGEVYHPDTKTARYLTDVPMIARALLEITDVFYENPEKEIESFHSICRYINRKWDAEMLLPVAADFYSRLLGEKNRVNRPDDEKQKVIEQLCLLIPNLNMTPSELQSAQADLLVPV